MPDHSIHLTRSARFRMQKNDSVSCYQHKGRVKQSLMFSRAGLERIFDRLRPHVLFIQEKKPHAAEREV